MKKNILLIAVAAVLVLFLVKGTKIQSVDEYYLTHMEDITEDLETVTISIRCDTLLEPENWNNLDEQLRDEKYVPSDGVILPETTYVLRKGDTVFDLLKRVCRYNEIQMDYQGPDPNVYSTIFIKKLKNHDRVEWVYTCDLGRDVGDDYMTRNNRPDSDAEETSFAGTGAVVGRREEPA